MSSSDEEYPQFELTPSDHVFTEGELIYNIDENQFDIYEGIIKSIKDGVYYIEMVGYPEDNFTTKVTDSFLLRTQKNTDIFLEQEEERKKKDEKDKRKAEKRAEKERLKREKKELREKEKQEKKLEKHRKREAKRQEIDDQQEIIQKGEFIKEIIPHKEGTSKDKEKDNLMRAVKSLCQCTQGIMISLLNVIGMDPKEVLNLKE